MKLAPLIDARLVFPDLVAGSSRDAIRLIVNRMVSAGVVDLGEDALRRLMEREKVMSTGIGGGVAIPHARTSDVEETVIGLARSRDGIPFDATDGAPVRLIFLLLGPPESSSEHVRVLAAIARLLKQPNLASRLLEAETAAGMLAIIQSEEERLANGEG